jgi:hypothetical protein
MKFLTILLALLGMMTVMATATTTASPNFSIAVNYAMQAPAESAECTLLIQTLHYLAYPLTHSAMPDVEVDFNDATTPRRCQSCWRYIENCQKVGI